MNHFESYGIITTQYDLPWYPRSDGTHEPLPTVGCIPLYSVVYGELSGWCISNSVLPCGVRFRFRFRIRIRVTSKHRVACDRYYLPR